MLRRSHLTINDVYRIVKGTTFSVKVNKLATGKHRRQQISTHTHTQSIYIYIYIYIK